jgi:hypothetical protein
MSYIEFTELQDVCCICLEIDNKDELQLICCKNLIHSKCLLMIFMENIYQCPLCREFIDPYNYFTIKRVCNTLNQFKTKLDVHKIDLLLMKLSNNYMNYTLNRYRIRILLLKNNILCDNSKLLGVVLFSIICIYLLLLFYIITVYIET